VTQSRPYLGFLIIDAAIEDKLRHKTPSLTGEEVREALQAPAAARAGWEDHPVHGRRVIAEGTTASGRVILAALHPIDETDGTWVVKTARARN
jgi:hypothetical protein